MDLLSFRALWVEIETVEILKRLFERAYTYYNGMSNIYKTFVLFLQDLQVEMDTERENYLSLTATGRKILSQIDGQEDATVIQKRLEEMNQRWNFLKAKSIAIR